MSFVITAIAPSPENLLGIAEDLLSLFPQAEPDYIDAKAFEIVVADIADHQAVYGLSSRNQVDIIIQPLTERRKKLFVADMDATIIPHETLDLLGDRLGISDQITPITERAMAGELDFKQALAERVKLLADVPATILDDVLNDMILTKGARTLVRTLAKNGCYCVLVSGGFTFFTGPVATAAGFEKNHGNTLGIKDGKLTGHVLEPILDQNAKLEFLEFYMKQLGLQPQDVMAIGDGANDIPMLKAAGLGIGFQPKEIVARTIPNVIRYNDLTAVLYALGFDSDDFVYD